MNYRLNQAFKKKISVILNVVEEPAQLNWCLHHIRLVYKSIIIIIISDGVFYSDYNKICNLYSAQYVKGERLKLASQGGKWWVRTLTYGLSTCSDFIIKIDPDTKIQRKIRSFPDYDICGSLIGEGKRWEHIQGGAQIFSRTAVKRIIESGFFLDTKLVDPKSYVWDNVLLQRAKSEDILWSDAMLQRAKSELGLSWGNCRDICCRWKELDHRYAHYAISHPHKLQKGSISSTSV